MLKKKKKKANLSIDLWTVITPAIPIHPQSYSFQYKDVVMQKCLKSLWPNDAILQHRSGSTLAQVMAFCLMAPSHYLNKCWLIISEVHWHLSEGNFSRYTSAINNASELESHLSKISFKSPRWQGVNSFRARFLSFAWGKLRLCSAYHRAGYFTLLQLHLHSQLNTWLQWIRQKQLQDETRSI